MALKHHLGEKKQTNLKPHEEKGLGQHPNLISQQGLSATPVCQVWECISRALQYLSQTFSHEHLNEFVCFFNTLEYFLG